MTNNTFFWVKIQGCRIDAQIRYIHYANPFHNRLKKGKWYMLKNFDISINDLPIRNSHHHLKLTMVYNTYIAEVTDKSKVISSTLHPIPKYGLHKKKIKNIALVCSNII